MIDLIVNDFISVGVVLFLIMIFYNLVAPIIGLPHLKIGDVIEIFRRS